jgi:hypothetical protein
VIREQGPESTDAALSDAASPVEIPDESGEPVVPSVDDVDPSFDDTIEESPELPGLPGPPELTSLAEPPSSPPASLFEPHPDASVAITSV